MVFSSAIFLFAYLPLTLTLYYLTPFHMRNAVLFAMSLVFYGWGEPVYILLMGASVTSAYFFGFLICRYRESNPRKAKIFLILSVGINLAFLFFFKYYRFFSSFLPIPEIDGLKLPIGISFYTFQILSYTFDLWKGAARLQRNYVSFGTYVTLFPQLVAGPIVKYQDIDSQLTHRTESSQLFAEGAARFCTGLGKKVLIGDGLAAGHAYFRQLLTVSPTVLGAWATAGLYTLHLYYDFSGYSDMAIGLGKLFGFRFPENFNYPYISKSISEFWRRWHMTLSSWFREYVYIPMGGNRHGKLKQVRNLLTVWLLTGFWHGANWNFILWGLYFGVLIVAEHLFFGKTLQKFPKTLQHLYTMGLVCVSFLIFSESDPEFLKSALPALVGVGCDGFSVPVATYELLRMAPLIAIATVGATPFPKRLAEKVCRRIHPAKWLIPVFSAAVLLISTAYLVDAGFSPFAYLNF